MHDGNLEPGISTGFVALDRHLVGGLKAGKQIVIAARPSIGKTSLAVAIAQACALAGNPAAVLSMEMEGAELVDRITANLGRIDLTRLTTGQLEDHEWSRLTEAVDALGKLPLYVDDQASLSLHDIRAKARKLKRLHGIKVLVIDYLQLCAASDQRQANTAAAIAGLDVVQMSGTEATPGVISLVKKYKLAAKDTSLAALEKYMGLNEKPVRFSLPPIDCAEDCTKAHGAVLAAVAAGRLGASEAKLMADLIDGQRRAYETQDLMRRMETMEQAIEELLKMKGTRT